MAAGDMGETFLTHRVRAMADRNRTHSACSNWKHATANHPTYSVSDLLGLRPRSNTQPLLTDNATFPSPPLFKCSELSVIEQRSGQTIIPQSWIHKSHRSNAAPPRGDAGEPRAIPGVQRVLKHRGPPEHTGHNTMHRKYRNIVTFKARALRRTEKRAVSRQKKRALRHVLQPPPPQLNRAGGSQGYNHCRRKSVLPILT